MAQTPVSALQSSLTLTEFLDLTGVFPPRGGGGSGPFLGSIGIFAGQPSIFAAPANGQTLAIVSNTALFSILGTDFGGNGKSTFELPNLGGVETIGAGQGAGLPLVGLGQALGRTSYDLTPAQLPPSLGGTSAAIDKHQPSLGLNYVINAFGVFPSGALTLDSLGVVSAFAGNFAPGGELLCDGQLLQISEYSALFSLLGTTYGGDGVTTFALPDLRGRDIVGAGGGFSLGEEVGSASVKLTDASSPLGSDAPFDNQQPGLVMNYYIALNGIYPSAGETGNVSQSTPYLGQIVACAENVSDPAGWALCNGQLLSIATNTALFSLIGTTYGGNGKTTFALPNLQGRTVLGAGGANGLGALGEVSGANAITLTSANLPLSDILWQNTDGQAAIWDVNSASLSLVGGGTVNPNPGAAWKAIGAGDFNGDGLSDILWQNADGQAAIWDMNGPTIVGGGTVSPNPGPSWKAIGTGDFNDDGHSDILWQNTNGQAAIWEMNGTAIVGGGAVSSNPGPTWKAVGTGDFNGDGHSDILWQNASGQVAIWEMNGTNIIGGGTVSSNPGPSWRAIGTNGGGSDILFQNTSGQAAIWEMNGTNIIGGGVVTANPGPSWKAIGLT